MEKTSRQRIADMLRRRETTPTKITEQFDTLSPDDIVEHIQHIARSLEETDETVLVAPPECRSCGFDQFDNPGNLPSQCPECRDTSIADPEFTIRATE